jgi:DNA polymerase-3 subunit epsilon
VTGFAIIDLETTGFAYNHTDRVCEVGVVLLDPNGQRETAWTTLVNPQRDLGAQHVHGIDATDARVAPLFEDIAGELTELLTGRVLVAHNTVFDTAFLVAEYARAGWPLDLTHEMTLCTMRLAQQYGAPASLGACCNFFGVQLSDAHAALADAEAAAALFALFLGDTRGDAAWERWLKMGEAFRWPMPPRRAVAPVLRGTTAKGSEVLAGVVGRFAPVDGLVGAAEYLDLLDRVLLDRKISADERRALDGLAASLGLTDADVERLNRHYMLGVVNAVCVDDQLTPNERAFVVQLAGLLDLRDLEIEGLLAAAESKVSRVVTDVDLKPGDLVVLTGMSMERKRELTAMAESRGLVVWPGVKKGVAAVIAQDPGSQSGKARKAREYGIPVVGERVFDMVALSLENRASTETKGYGR